MSWRNFLWWGLLPGVLAGQTGGAPVMFERPG
jgi:hypothetical protein